MRQLFFRISLILSVLIALGAAGAMASVDIAVERIDTDRLQCGGCPGYVDVEVKNRGNSNLSGGYTVWVELRVVPAGDVHNDKTYKKSFQNLNAGQTKTISFDNIRVQSCYQVASTFSVKTYITGGNLREGNTRNNDKSISKPISRRCPTNGGGNNGGGHGNSGSNNNNQVDGADFLVWQIDVSKVKSGGCEGAVAVEIKNQGRKLSGGYTLWTELRVVPAGDVHNAKTYKKSFPAHDIESGGKKTVYFDEVEIHSTYQTASTFSVKTYLTGGNYREGNTRNNEKSISKPISKRCPSTGGNSGSGSGNSGGGNGQSGNSGNTQYGSTDFEVYKVDTSRLKAGGCEGTLGIEIKNRGRKLSGGYTLWTEVRVVPAGDTNNAKKYKTSFPTHEIESGGKKTVYFNDVKILRTVQEASNFEVKLYVTGGNFREGNNRNNTKRVSEVIRNRCTGGNQQGGGHQGGGNGGTKPDLYTTYFRPSSTLCCGQQHELKASIKNKGRVKIEEKVELKLTRKISGESDKTYYTSLDRGIVANRIESVKFRNVEIPCGVPTTFEMVIDPNSKIAEADERNNTRTSQVTFNRTCN